MLLFDEVEMVFLFLSLLLSYFICNWPSNLVASPFRYTPSLTSFHQLMLLPLWPNVPLSHTLIIAMSSNWARFCPPLPFAVSSQQRILLKHQSNSIAFLFKILFVSPSYWKQKCVSVLWSKFPHMVCLSLTPWNCFSDFMSFILLLDHSGHLVFCFFFFLNSSYDSPTGFWTCYLLYQIYCSPNIYTTSSFLASLSSYKWIPFCTAHLKKFTFLPDTSNSLLLSNYFLLGRYSYLTNYYLIITYIACLWHWNISFKKKVVFPFCVQLYSQMHKTVFDT